MFWYEIARQFHWKRCGTTAMLALDQYSVTADDVTIAMIAHWFRASVYVGSASLSRWAAYINAKFTFSYKTDPTHADAQSQRDHFFFFFLSQLRRVSNDSRTVELIRNSYTNTTKYTQSRIVHHFTYYSNRNHCSWIAKVCQHTSCFLVQVSSRAMQKIANEKAKSFKHNWLAFGKKKRIVRQASQSHMSPLASALNSKVEHIRYSVLKKFHSPKYKWTTVICLFANRAKERISLLWLFVWAWKKKSRRKL